MPLEKERGKTNQCFLSLISFGKVEWYGMRSDRGFAVREYLLK